MSKRKIKYRIDSVLSIQNECLITSKWFHFVQFDSLSTILGKAMRIWAFNIVPNQLTETEPTKISTRKCQFMNEIRSKDKTPIFIPLQRKNSSKCYWERSLKKLRQNRTLLVHFELFSLQLILKYRWEIRFFKTISLKMHLVL